MALRKQQLWILCIVNISQAIMLSLPFTIAVYMVRHFFSGSDEKTIGRMTGALAASYSFAQFTSSYPLGLISNRFGRKPVVLLGVVSSAVALFCFGNAPSYSVAAVARLVGGLLNGTVGAWKCMVGEKCNPTEQGQAMGWLSLSWGVGNILGPSVGGYLTNVCERWPPTGMCAEGALLQRRPFLLPCLFGGAICLVATLAAALFLEETLPAAAAGRSRHEDPEAEQGAAAGEYVKLLGEEEEERTPMGCWLSGPPLVQSLDGVCTVATPTSDPLFAPRQSVVAMSPMKQQGSENEREALLPPPLLLDPAAGRERERESDAQRLEEVEDSGAVRAAGAGWAAGRQLSARPPLPKRGNMVVDVHMPADDVSEQSDSDLDRPGDWHKNKQVLLTIAGFTMCSLVWCTLDETVPIFASALPSKGGLGMKAAMLALPLATGGMTTILYAVWGYPRLQKRYGAFNVARAAYCLAVLVCLLLPTTSLLHSADKPHHAKALLLGTYILKALAQCSTFTSAIILVNAACHPSQLGAVNGVAQMLASLVRGIGPATSGLLWAASLELSRRSLHQFVPFLVVALLSMLTMALYGRVCRRLRR